MAIDTGADSVSLDDNGFAFKKATDIVKDSINQILTHTDRINDFTPGSVTRTLVESEAIEIEKLYYYTLENLQQAIDDSVTSAFGFERKQATYAYGNVTIVLNSNLTQDMVIDRGTRFYSSQPAYEQVYRTMVAYRIPKGTRSFTIQVYCTVLGSYGNIPSGVIDRTDDIGTIASINNREAFNTGQDEETPDQTKIRFRKMIQSLSRSTDQSLVYAAETVPGVVGAYLYESTYGSVVLYCHDLNGDLSTDLQRQIADKLVEYKPAGINVFVRPTHKTLVSLNVQITVSDDNLKQRAFLQIVRRALSNYINQFTVGEPLYVADVLQKVMDLSDTGILDASVTARVYPDPELLSEPYVADDTVLNIKNVRVDQPYLRPVDITNNEHYGEVGVDNTKFKQKNGQTWKDAIVETDEGKETHNLITEYANGDADLSKELIIDDVYVTNPNEILRLALCNVRFTPEEGDTTVVQDNGGDQA